jgi:hypothetical protein
METENFGAEMLSTLVSSFEEWEKIQTYFLSNPFARQYSGLIHTLTSSRLQEVSPMDILYFTSLRACWPLVIRVSNEQDFVRLLSLKSLTQAIVYFDSSFFSYTQRYVNTIQSLSDVFFLFLGPEGGISVFFGETFADLDFIPLQAEYPEELDERLALGLRKHWPQQETVTFSPKTEVREMIVVPTTFRRSGAIDESNVIASQDHLQHVLGKKIDPEPSTFFRPDLILNNIHVQVYFR